MKIPDELRNVSAILPRYSGEIPYHSLVLVAYTVSLYHVVQGSRKDQPTVPLNISFAVVLQDRLSDSNGSDFGEDGEDAHDGDSAEKDSDDAGAKEGKKQTDVEDDLSDEVSEEVGIIEKPVSC